MTIIKDVTKITITITGYPDKPFTIDGALLAFERGDSAINANSDRCAR